MHRFFAERINDDTARLTAQEAHHALKVLRLKPGDEVQLIMEDALYSAVLSADAPEVLARVGARLPSPEPRLKVTLYQGLPKADKVDWIVQKNTEAGIDRICLLEMVRSVSRFNSSQDVLRKTERWARIAQEAAKQSGRAHVPGIEVIRAADLPACLQRHELVLVPWEEEHGRSLSRAAQTVSPLRDAAIVIGPEGGITPEEIDGMRACGAVPVTLGPRIFRTETAGLAAAVMLLSACGEYGPSGGD